MNEMQKKPVNLLKLTLDEKKSFLNSFDLVFSDCDGVIWTPMQEKISNTDNAINFLRKMNKKVVFVTNNSLRPLESQIKKLIDSGIEVDKENVIQPIQLIIQYLKENNIKGPVYSITNKPSKDALIAAGIEVLDGPHRLIEETFEELSTILFDKDAVQAIIIDVDFNLTAIKLMRAHLYLKRNPDCILIGGAFDRTIPFGNTEIIGPGPFISVVEYSTGVKAKLFGKPGKELGEMLNRRYNINSPEDAKKVLFIGDSMDSDILFAKKLGYQTLLVLTGLTTKDLFEEITNNGNEDIPDYFLESLSDLDGFL